MFNDSSAERIAKDLRESVKRYRVGTKIPSNRELVRRYHVSAGTISHAIAVLVREGLVQAYPGSGVFRAPDRSGISARVDCGWQDGALHYESGSTAQTIRDAATGVLSYLTTPPSAVMDLASGYLHSSLQPEAALAAAFARAGRRPGAWNRPPVEGVSELREWFARDIASGISASEVLVCSGGQNALSTILRSIASPGSPVLVESPTYPGLLAAARAAGLIPVPVPVDSHGVRDELLLEAWNATGARVFVCQPLFHNPTGATLSLERRSRVLEAAKKAGAFIVEDDFVRRLSHGGALPAPLISDDTEGRVIHIHSLTKATSPNIRVGAIIAQGPVLERLRYALVVDNFFVSKPLQDTVVELVGSPAWPKHLRYLSAQLALRQHALRTAFTEFLPDWEVALYPPGGYHVWARLPPHCSDEENLLMAARHAGVAVSQGAPYWAGEPAGKYIRVSYSAVAELDNIGEGVRRLAEGWRSVRAS